MHTLEEDNNSYNTKWHLKKPKGKSYMYAKGVG